MLKKVMAVIVLISLLTVAMIQAMDKKTESKNESKSLETSLQTDGLQIGAKAPDFELKALTGDKVKLSSLKGKKVMLNFWATWCPPCKEEMPEMEQFYKEGHQDIVILAVNIDPHMDVKGFVDTNGITFPILLDKDDLVNENYKILSIPTTYFIDRRGMIQSKYIGAMNQEIIKQFTNTLK